MIDKMVTSKGIQYIILDKFTEDKIIENNDHSELMTKLTTYYLVRRADGEKTSLLRPGDIDRIEIQ